MTEVDGNIVKYPFLEGGGEMGKWARAYKWTATPLGPISSWSPTLRFSVSMVFHSNFPMILLWGDELIQIYNDAYRSILGEDGKNPEIFGKPARDTWPEGWRLIDTLVKQVSDTGQSLFAEDQPVPIYRNGHLETVYWTYSYNPVLNERGSVNGILGLCIETTKTVLSFKQLEETKVQLEHSESNLRNMILQSPFAICILKGPHHVIEIANERMFKLLGRGDQLVGKPAFDGLPEAKHQGYEELLDQVYTTGETFTAYGMPVTLPRGDSTQTVYVQFVFEPYRGLNGVVNGVMVVAIDVTNQVLALKKVEESENKLRSVVESAPFPIGVYEGREMRTVLANKSIIDVWGKGREVVGKTYYELLPELEVQQIYPQLDGVFTTGIPFHARNQQVNLVVSGELKEFFFNYSFTPLFDTHGKVYGVMNTAADVTDMNVAKRKVEQSEKNIRNMILQAPVAMCLMSGPEHVVEVANSLMFALWGKTPQQVLNKPIFEGLPDAREQGLEALLFDVYHTGRSFHANERPVVLFRKGRYETIYQNFVYEPYRDTDGRITGIVAITIDVTDQVAARQKIEDLVTERTKELAVANSDLQRSNAELSQFAYIASHDLQEPARKISTFIEMLKTNLGDSIDQRSKTYLEKIDLASSRMLRLIRDILAISQLSKANYSFEKVDLNKILIEIKNDLELLIAQKDCTIEYDWMPTIDAIPIQMNQLFSNLISNSLKFVTHGQRLKLKIKAAIVSPSEVAEHKMLKQAPHYCHLSFTDNGIGFNQSNAEQIFNIFQRLHAKSEYQGTGIGLAMCRKIAENHGGHIFATSSPGAGATFTVILPMKQD
jgi:PAS domain S-box-containing protein